MAIELDPFLKSSQIATARNWSTRWLHEQIKRGKFPKPDRPASKRGEPNLWRTSTVKRALDALTDQGGPGQQQSA